MKVAIMARGSPSEWVKLDQLDPCEIEDHPDHHSAETMGTGSPPLNYLHIDDGNNW